MASQMLLTKNIY